MTRLAPLLLAFALSCEGARAPRAPTEESLARSGAHAATSASGVPGAAALSASSPTPRAPPTMELREGVALRLQRPARVALAAPGAVVTLSPDYRALVAFDPKQGAELWRTPLEGEPSGVHTLALRDGEIVVKAGDRIFFVDPKSGAVARKNLDVPHCAFDSVGGACAFDCGCAAFVVDCSTLKQSALLQGAEVHLYHNIGEPHDTVCAFAPQILGRVGDRILATVPDGGGTGISSDGVLVALDAATGQEMRRGPGVRRYGGAAGVSTTSGGCWIADGAAAELVMTDCISGAVRWRAALATPTHARGLLDVRALPGGDLFVRHLGGAGSELARFNAANGRPRWSRSIAGYAGVLDDEPLSAVYAHGLKGYEALSSADGRTLARLDAPDDAWLMRDVGRPGFVLTGGGVYRELDAAGKPARELRYSPIGNVIRMTPEYLIERGGGAEGGLRVLRRSDLAVVARFEGRVDVFDSDALDPRFVLLARATEADAPQILVLELPPAPR